MKRLSIVFLLCLCALAGYLEAIGPRSPAGGASAPFTGGTLTSNLTMSDGTIIELATGTSTNLALRFRSHPTTGILGGAVSDLKLRANGVNVFDTSNIGTQITTAAGRWINVSDANGYTLTNTDFGYYTAGAGRFRPTVVASSTQPTYTWTDSLNTGLGRHAIGQPSMVASGTEAMRFTATGTYTPGFSQFGAGSPGLKCKLITGVMPSVVASTTTIAHGLDYAKIVNYSVNIGGGGFKITSSAAAEYNFSYLLNTTALSISTEAGSTGIVGWNITCLIWYTE